MNNGIGERMRSAASLSVPGRLGLEARRAWPTLCLAIKGFFRVDGGQWAGAFAFNAFFSLFPLMVLSVTIASPIVDWDRTGKKVIFYMESHVPIDGEMQRHIFATIAGVIKAHHPAGVIALLILVWTALQCFTTLICATNRAWGTAVYRWWQLPLKSMLLLGITAGAVLLGMAAPVLIRMVKDWFFPAQDFRSWVFGLGSFSIPFLVVFIGLSLFYRLAPRRPTRFAEVWAAALCTAVLLRASESLFVIYLKHFATLNAVYGAFGGIVALLLWIYVSGCVVIFGACLCAGQAAIRSPPEK